MIIGIMCISIFIIGLFNCDPEGDDTQAEFVGTWVRSTRAPTIEEITLSETFTGDIFIKQ